MADNVAITAGSGTTIATDDVGGGIQVQRIKATWGPDGTANDTDVATGKPMPVQLRGSDGTDRSNLLPTSNVGNFVTVSSSVTRPNDTNAYTANDAWADSTSAPTAGGFTLSSSARSSGGSGIITDLIVNSTAAPATMLQGEIWLYDSAATAVNDNAAFASVIGDTNLLVGVIPFTLASVVSGTTVPSFAHVQGLAIGFTCVGTANLRYKIKVKNAYTPIAQEILQIRAKIIQTN